MAESAAAEPTGSAAATTDAPPDPAAPLLTTGDEAAKTKAGEATPEAKAADKDADNKDPKAAEVPAKYDLKLPEGTMVDEGMMQEFQDWAHELKLDPQGAQRAADMHLKSIGLFAQRQEAEFVAQVNGWGDEIKADKEFGGAKIDETLAIARRVLGTNADGSPVIPGINLKRLHNDLFVSGLQAHPDMIKVFHFIGSKMGEDTMTPGGGGGAVEVDAAKKLYPQQN